MKNPNSRLARARTRLLARWSAEDFPGAEPRFQLQLLAKDMAVFIFLPVGSIVLFKMAETRVSAPKARPPRKPDIREVSRMEPARSQIIEFSSRSSGAGSASAPRRSPGSLVRVKLLNVVETYSNAPVHAQIVDEGLGSTLLGGTLIGDATPDSTFERIGITFNYARDPRRENIALPIAARALGLDGTLGLPARKKEGLFARSVLSSANTAGQNAQGQNGSQDLRDILLRTLAAGFIQELGSGAQVEHNRAQVLTLMPGTEFFAELTDFFPGSGK